MSARLLLVTPTFHDYWRSISAAFALRGYDVHVCRYDSRDSLLTKAHHKVRHELPQLLGRSTLESERRYATRQAVAAIEESRPDIVVTIKGDVLDEPYWDAIDSRGARHVLWLYDELRRTHHSEASLHRAGAIATYSPLDAQALADQGHRAALVHLAFDPNYPVAAVPVTNEVSFIGARYPQREATLLALVDAGVSIRAYGRQWSKHPLDRARTWQITRPNVPAQRDVSREEAYGVMSASAATVNIHGDQDGFTMRTFEAAGVGGLQLIDRSDVGSLYEPDTEIVTYGSVAELIELSQRVQADPLWAKRIREAGAKRTVTEHTFVQRVAQLEELWG